MSCICATSDGEGRYKCSVSGDSCVYMFPDSQRCARDFGEGPDVVEEDNKTESNLENLEDIFKENGYTEEMIKEIKYTNEANEISDFIDNLEEERSCWNC